MYFPRYVIGSVLTACFAVVIKYLEKYLTIFHNLHKYVSEKIIH